MNGSLSTYYQIPLLQVYFARFMILAASFSTGRNSLKSFMTYGQRLSAWIHGRCEVTYSHSGKYERDSLWVKEPYSIIYTE
jgi:hypothetical protein